jgi:hypothetical protein
MRQDSIQIVKDGTAGCVIIFFTLLLLWAVGVLSWSLLWVAAPLWCPAVTFIAFILFVIVAFVVRRVRDKIFFITETKRLERMIISRQRTERGDRPLQ